MNAKYHYLFIDSSVHLGGNSYTYMIVEKPYSMHVKKN